MRELKELRDGGELPAPTDFESHVPPVGGYFWVRPVAGANLWIGYVFDDETISFTTITHGPPQEVTRWWERPDPDE